jgi:hypothetical protein
VGFYSAYEGIERNLSISLENRFGLFQYSGADGLAHKHVLLLEITEDYLYY